MKLRIVTLLIALAPCIALSAAAAGAADPSEAFTAGSGLEAALSDQELGDMADWLLEQKVK